LCLSAVIISEQGPADVEDDEEEWGGIQSDHEVEVEDDDSDGESDTGSTEGAPTLVADSSDEGEKEPVKPPPASQRKRRKGD
jgi:hypothetical protein